MIDRTYSLYTNANQPDHVSLVDGQRQALVATGAGGFDENAEGMVDSIRRKAVDFAGKIVS